MGEAFIVRKGGVTVERTTAPSINFVSKTDSEIVVTFTNNDAAEAEVYYGITSTLTDTVTLAAAATSSNITFSGLDGETTFTVSAYALVTDPTSKKIKSEIVSTNITTEIPAPTITLVSKTTDSITFTLTNNSVQERDVTFGLTTPPTTTTITLASNATSGNQTFSNLDDDTTFIIFAQAEGGIIGQLSVTTDSAPVFTAATGGTTLEYDSGGKRFRSHTFTSNGNFIVSTVGDNVDDRNKVDYLIIAGGGGGSNDSAQGASGGGAGGYRTTNGTSGRNSSAESKFTVTATTFGITIGAGGSNGTPANAGSNTSALQRTSTGGGRGYTNEFSAPGNGGSGSGALGRSGTIAGGAGTANQGFNGGSGTSDETNFRSVGGGGGAGQAGINGPANSGPPGAGGNGLANTLRTGSSETRAGGGGSKRIFQSSVGGSGGGGTGSTGTAGSGTANTGSGGGGGATGGSGGSGIVVIRYEIAPSV